MLWRAGRVLGQYLKHSGLHAYPPLPLIAVLNTIRARWYTAHHRAPRSDLMSLTPALEELSCRKDLPLNPEDAQTSLSISELVCLMNAVLDRHDDCSILCALKKSAPLHHCLSNAQSAYKLAEAMTETQFPHRAQHILSLSHRLGIRFKQNAYECVAYRLSVAQHWQLIPPIVTLGKRHTGRTTVRLLNWRAFALSQSSRFALLQGVLDDFDAAGLKPNRRTFHIVITGHLRNVDLRRAQVCLRLMEDAGFPADASTHAVVLSAYRKLGPDPQVRARALACLDNANAYQSTVLLNGLLQVYLGSYDLTGALDVLRLSRLRKHHVVPSHPFVGETITLANGDDNSSVVNGKFSAIDLSDGSSPIRSLGPFPDVATYTILIDHLARQKDLPQAFRIVERMAASGIIPDDSTFAALVRACCSAGEINLAVKIVAELCKDHTVDPALFIRLSTPLGKNHILPLIPLECSPTTQIFNALLKGILPSRGLNGIRITLRIMHSLGIAPDADTVETFATYLDEMESARPRDVIHVVRRLYGSGIRPTVQHANVIIRCILHNERSILQPSSWVRTFRNVHGYQTHRRISPAGNRLTGTSPYLDPTAGILVPRKLKLAKIILRSLVARHVRSNRAAFALRMQRDAVNRLDAESAVEVFRTMVSRGIHPNEYHYSALMEGYASTGRIRAAKAIMKSAVQAGIKPNVVMFTTLIVGYARLGIPQRAMRTFQLMMHSGIKPDVASVDAVVSAYFAVGAYATARSVLLDLWPLIAPLPEDLVGAPLKSLAKSFRALDPTNFGRRPKAKSKHQQRLLRWKLNKVVNAWRGQIRSKRKRWRPVVHSRPTETQSTR